MGRRCMVPECLSEEGRCEDRGVTFHKIPLHSDIRPKWMSLCRISDDKYTVKVVHVCSRHFLKANFYRFKGKKYMLKQGVLPSVFPWTKLKKEPGSASPENVISSKLETTKEDLTSIDSEAEVVDNICIKTEQYFTEADYNIKIEVKEEPMETSDEVALNSPHKEISSDIVEVQPGSSTTIEQQGKCIQTAFGTVNLKLNSRLEALDFNQIWLPARIIEIDYEENEVLIHFEKYSSMHDEWINMNSSRLRPIQLPAKKIVSEQFVEGEKCLAPWSDARKFPAVVTKVIDKDTYEVMFNDGFLKVLKGHRMAKADGKTIGSAPLFDPAKGTKQDRRDKKRKINVAQLFRKRKIGNVEETTTTTAADEGVVGSNEELESYVPKWENGRPVGIESTVETSDGVRKSIIIDDPRLPSGWKKHLVQKNYGTSTMKWEALIISPEGRRFRTRAEIRVYLEENQHLNYSDSMFNFNVYKRAKRRPVTAPEPPPEVTVTDQIPAPSMSPTTLQNEETSSSLKILLIDDVYKCPIEGCGKHFRRMNLAQMHVKHYHPKYVKYLDSTPNVADLAYARTVGESLDKSPDRLSRSVVVKHPPKSGVAKTSTPKIYSSSAESEHKTVLQNLDSQTGPPLQKAKDSEILKLLNNKPPIENTPKYPSGLPPSMYPDIKLKDLLNKSEGIPKHEDLNLKTLSASTARPTGIKTLLPVVRSNKKENDTDRNVVGDSEVWPHGHKISYVRTNLKRKRQISENNDLFKPKENTETAVTNILKHDTPTTASAGNSSYIVEGGEVIKIVRMKREEIINCTCGITEEDGLMIQCELCLCWQHAYCNNIQRENQVPEKYICNICQNPLKQRSSRKYYFDQDWLKNGTLPVANYHCKDNETLKKRFEILKKSHDMTGGLLELKDFLHSLKVKLKIAETKDHPKLYLWSKPSEKQQFPESIETRQNGNKSKSDLLDERSECQNDSILLNILKTEKDEQKLNDELDLNTLIDNNLSQLSMPIIPQPEAAIESADCQLNLLDHIVNSQSLVEQRLNEFEQQLDEMDGNSNCSDEDFTRTCQTVQMLLKDLNTLKELSCSNSL